MKFIKILLTFIYISANISLQAQLPELIPYNKNGKWGYSDSLRNIVIPCEYDSVNFFQNGFAVVGNCIDKVCLSGVIDMKGKLIVPVQYDKIEDFNEAGVAKAYRGDNLGIVDKSGKEIVPCIYTLISAPWNNYKDYMTKVSLDGKVGLINHKGIVSLPVQYDQIGGVFPYYWRRSEFKIPIIEFKLNERHGFADSIGNILVHAQYDHRVFESNHYIIMKNEDKFALYDKTNGKEIFPCKYDNISIIGDREGLSTYFLLMINNYWGIADSKGKIILPLEYDNINVLGDILQVRKEGENFLYNNRGEKLPVKKYEIVEWFNPYKVRMNGKWGVIDSTGNEIIPCQYDNVMWQRNIGAIIAVKDGKYGLFTSKGEEITPCVYDPIEQYYSDSYKPKQTLIVSQNGKRGLINIELRKEVIPCEYYSIRMFNSNMYGVSISSQYSINGLIDDKGKVVLPCECEEIYQAYGHPNIVNIKKHGKYGLYDLNNSEWFIPIGKYQGRLGDGINPFILKKDGKFGFVDSTGRKELTEFKYDNISTIYNRNIRSTTNNHFLETWIKDLGVGVISRQGEEIIPCEYDEIDNYDSLFFVRKDNKWGAINHKGKILQDCIYSKEEKESWRNRNRWIIIKENDRFGAINANGEIVLEPIYRKIIANWQPNTMSVRCENWKWGVLDSLGKEIIPCLYNEVKPIKNGLIAVNTNNLCGVRDLQNNEILACEYKEMVIAGVGINLSDKDYGYREFKSDNFIKANKDNLWGLFGKDGEELIPLKYDNIVILSNNLYVAYDNQNVEFYNNKGVKITSSSDEKQRDYFYVLRGREYRLIKTDNGYIDIYGTAYFEQPEK